MRLIDADSLIICECGRCDGYCDICGDGQACLECDSHNKCALRDAIDTAPTVDAVPVIRCRDCGYAILDRWHKSKEDRPPVWRCRKTGRLTVPNGFCHRGKIREEDQNATD